MFIPHVLHLEAGTTTKMHLERRCAEEIGYTRDSELMMDSNIRKHNISQAIFSAEMAAISNRHGRCRLTHAAVIDFADKRVLPHAVAFI